MGQTPKVVVEICPETGICSIVKASGEKIDLMPDELTQLRHAEGPVQAQSVLAEVDPNFANALDSELIKNIREQVK